MTEYTVAVDNKYRIRLPAKLSEQLAGAIYKHATAHIEINRETIFRQLCTKSAQAVVEYGHAEGVQVEFTVTIEEPS